VAVEAAVDDQMAATPPAAVTVEVFGGGVGLARVAVMGWADAQHPAAQQTQRSGHVRHGRWIRFLPCSYTHTSMSSAVGRPVALFLGALLVTVGPVVVVVVGGEVVGGTDVGGGGSCAGDPCGLPTCPGRVGGSVVVVVGLVGVGSGVVVVVGGVVVVVGGGRVSGGGAATVGGGCTSRSVGSDLGTTGSG